jgi:formate transporter
MHNPVDKMAFLGFMAGIWVGFGGIAATTVAGGIFSPKFILNFLIIAVGIPSDVRDTWPILPKLGLALFFPFALVKGHKAA